MDNPTFAILIPAYQPDAKLIALVDALIQKGLTNIVVVDDGGGDTYAPIFSAIADRVTVLTHEVNRGKGAALKTGLAYIHQTPGMAAVTADADGQHTPDDIERMIDAMRTHPNDLVLGVRDKKQMPPRSKFGNTTTCFMFMLLTGTHISDTQTGLRGIPASAMERFIALEGNRYEYEINMLMTATHEHIPIFELTISTIYLEDNKSSHFDTLRDSARIYGLMFRQFFKFIASSLISWGIDYSLYALMLFLTSGNLFIAVGVSRACSSFANYCLNSHVVFKGIFSLQSLLRYYVLVVIIAALSYLGILGLTQIGVHEMLAKLIMDIVLFFINFNIQKRFIFANKAE